MADGGACMTETTFTPDANNAPAFRDALGRFATGSRWSRRRQPTGRWGSPPTAFASLSLDPPLVLWSPAKSSRASGVCRGAHYSIHVLGRGSGDWLAALRARRAGFDGLAHEVNAEGVPVIPGRRWRGSIANSIRAHEGGDHLIVVGRCCARSATGAPLVFSQGNTAGFSAAGWADRTAGHPARRGRRSTQRGGDAPVRAFAGPDPWPWGDQRRRSGAGPWLGALCMGLMVVIILTQVFFRYVLGNALAWPEEASRFLMLWMTGLMAAPRYRRGGFVAIDMLVRLLPRMVATV
jgi:flavin reductase (DIM6/NTAB) family NADH-FMN oxidoreductase RutF